MTLSGSFYALVGAGFTRRQALALAIGGYTVVGWQRVEVRDAWAVAS